MLQGLRGVERLHRAVLLQTQLPRHVTGSLRVIFYIFFIREFPPVSQQIRQSELPLQQSYFKLKTITA